MVPAVVAVEAVVLAPVAPAAVLGRREGLSPRVGVAEGRDVGLLYLGSQDDARHDHLTARD
jgi:hypothetical protein